MIRKAAAMMMVLSMVLALAGCGDIGTASASVNPLMEDLTETVERAEGGAGSRQSGDPGLGGLEGLLDGNADLEALSGLLGGDSGRSSQEDPPEESGPSGNGSGGDTGSGILGMVSNDTVKTFIGGSYYMKYTAYVMGMEMTGEMAAKGADSDTRGEMMGMPSHVLVLDGATYNIDDAAGTYAVSTDASAVSGTGLPVGTDLSKLEYKGSGSGQISSLVEAGVDSESYDYQEFLLKVDPETMGGMEESITMRFYTKGEELHAMTVEVMGMEVAMVIEEFSTSIPAGMLALPSGYTQVDSIY